jgi:AcrR family transcriptional regulator
MTTSTEAKQDSATRARRRRTRNSLSRDEIVAAAVKLVEAEGLAQLSMPALARELGCAAMSIYNYFSSKDVLIEAVAHQVMHDLHHRLPPAGDGPWDVELIAYFTTYRDYMLSLPAYREIVLHAPTASIQAALVPAQLRRLDSGLGILCSAGLSAEDAARIYNLCYNYTRSYVAVQCGVDQSGRTASVVEGGVDVDPEDYPLLAALGDPGSAIDLHDDGFGFGLEVIADGVSHRYGLTRTSRRPATRGKVQSKKPPGRRPAMKKAGASRL